MDGSNPTHKLWLSITFCGKSRKEKENSVRSSFSQERNWVDPSLLTPLVALAVQLLQVLQIIPTLGSWSDLWMGSAWLLAEGPQLLGICQSFSCMHELCFLAWPEVAIRCAWIGRENCLKGKEKHFWRWVHVTIWFLIISLFPVSPSLLSPHALWSSAHFPPWISGSLHFSPSLPPPPARLPPPSILESSLACFMAFYMLKNDRMGFLDPSQISGTWTLQVICIFLCVSPPPILLPYPLPSPRLYRTSWFVVGPDRLHFKCLLYTEVATILNFVYLSCWKKWF